jgi:subtilisin-like proprotein convertase family protein
MRRAHLLGWTGCLVAALATPARASGPDVIVGSCSDVGYYGPVGTLHGYAVGTTSCNIGDTILQWVSSTNHHPVIAQNMYRLKNGRIEQIGMSWLKHAFAVAPGDTCDTCTGSGGGLHPGCSDPYGSGLNGGQTRLGPRSEVNALTGAYPYPYILNWQSTGDNIFKRIQVEEADIDPALNAGALYFVEGHYISFDDAAAGNGYNNASYRRVIVNSGLTISVTGATAREKPAIMAWAEHGLGVGVPDPDVTLHSVDDPDGGRFWVASKASDLGGGQWHYEYAVFNLNSDRSLRGFLTPRDPAGSESAVGWHGVESHSDEPYSNAAWSNTVQTAGVVWNTDAHSVDPNANAVRWSTMHNFWFDSDQPPVNTFATLELFKPGSGNLIYAQVSAPGAADCNTNGQADDVDVIGGAADCNLDTIPDDCQLGGNDCNDDGVPDDCELAGNDCNTDGIPDDCQLSGGDCDSNGVPDACQSDCDDNGTIDICEPGGAEDCDGNGVSDVCDPDCDTNGVPDACDIAGGAQDDCNTNGIPELCETSSFSATSIPSLAIPSNTTVTDDLVAMSGAVVADVNVGLDITHTWDSDLTISMAHSSTTVTLSSGNGGSGNHYVDTYFDDEAATPITSGSPPFTGSFRPQSPLTAFDSASAGGVWTLIVTDSVGGDTGTLLSWLIDIDTPLIDCNSNGAPDECETDCNTNGMPDDCDIGSGGSADGDGNGVPDECGGSVMECMSCPGDVNGDGAVDGEDVHCLVECLVGGATAGCGSCDCADVNLDTVVDSDDAAAFVAGVMGGATGCP